MALLSESPDLLILGAVATVREAISMAEERGPNVVLMDSRLSDGSGSQAAARIHHLHPDIAIVFLSADESDEAVLAAVESGACGYLSKTVAGPQLHSAIRSAAGGEMLVSAELLARLAGRQRTEEARALARARLVEGLTVREHQVLELLAGGLDNRQIAGRLGIAYGTVRTHVRNLLDKIGVHSRLEAVARAGQDGLLVASDDHGLLPRGTEWAL